MGPQNKGERLPWGYEALNGVSGKAGQTALRVPVGRPGFSLFPSEAGAARVTPSARDVEDGVGIF
jgi:hypothetical protein